MQGDHGCRHSTLKDCAGFGHPGTQQQAKGGTLRRLSGPWPAVRAELMSLSRRHKRSDAPPGAGRVAERSR